MIDLMTELNKYGITERGNTSLVEAECGGGTAMYVELEEGSEIRTHIEENYGNYYFQKNNIGANAYGRMPVDHEYVMEAVRDQLHIYRDNKSVDTVTFIHNFLESKEWTLDIADIEILRQEADEE